MLNVAKQGCFWLVMHVTLTSVSLISCMYLCPLLCNAWADLTELHRSDLWPGFFFYIPFISSPRALNPNRAQSLCSSCSAETPVCDVTAHHCPSLPCCFQEGFKMGLTLEGTVFSLDPLDGRCWCQEDALCHILLTRLYEEVPKSTPQWSQDVAVFILRFICICI